VHYNNVMRILNWILNILLLACATSCINRTEIIDNSHHLFVISVKDVGFTPENNQKATRAIDNGYATTFTKGDQMGLYVLDASGNVKMANLCLTYDGTNWNYPAGATLYYDDTSRKYFTYYPYQSTVVGAPTTSTATTATSFFSTLISNWTPSTDQSSQAKYTASDLMVGTGTVGALASNATRPLIFNMTHQMALIDLNVPYYYLSTDNSYTYTLGLTYSGFKPFHLSKGNFRYIIRPATSTSIWGYYCPTNSSSTSQVFNKAFSVATGTYQTMNVDGGAVGTSHTLAIGDYYLNDGSIIANTPTNEFLLNKVIGVVFSTSTSTIDKGHGWTHGYAMALKNAAKNIVWGPNAVDTPISNISSESDIKNSMDGYTETHLINSTYSLSPTNYPVFYYALNYNVATPKGSSGWYLPSIGQWYSVIVNLGKVPTASTSINIAELGWSNGEISSCATNVNKYLAALDNGYRVDKFYTSPGTSECYSATSEYTSNYSYRLYFQSAVNILWLDGNNDDDDKALTCYISRPAIAF